MTNKDALAFIRLLKKSGQIADSQTTAVYDEASGKEYEISVKARRVPSTLKESYGDRVLRASAGGVGVQCPTCGGAGRI